MQWDIPYVVSRSLSFEILRTGRLAAITSISRPPQDLDLDALPVLLAFAAGATPREVAIEESKIAHLAERMFRANGCDGIVELRRANSRDVELDEPADLLIHEILGIDPFEENLTIRRHRAQRGGRGSCRLCVQGGGRA